MVCGLHLQIWLFIIRVQDSKKKRKPKRKKEINHPEKEQKPEIGRKVGRSLVKRGEANRVENESLSGQLRDVDRKSWQDVCLVLGGLCDLGRHIGKGT